MKTAANKNTKRDKSEIIYETLEAAHNGDYDAMRAAEELYERYICAMATISLSGNRRFNVDLYDRMKSRLIWLILKKF